MTYLIGGHSKPRQFATILALFAEQRRQLGDVARYAPRLVFGEHAGDVGGVFCLAGIDISERLPVSIKHLEAAQ